MWCNFGKWVIVCCDEAIFEFDLQYKHLKTSWAPSDSVSMSQSRIIGFNLEQNKPLVPLGIIKPIEIYNFTSL